MTAKLEQFQLMRDDLDYREPWDQAGSMDSASNQVLAAKEFHFREAGFQRFNDTYDWDEDER